MFDAILGNEALKEILNRLCSAGRMPNSALFSGPDGVGKRLFALEIGRRFVCTAGNACGKCSACVRVGQIELPKPDNRDAFKKVLFTNHPDVGVVMAPGRQIHVDAIRDLEAEAHFRPYEAKGRTFIIDDADKMNPSSSNALLKTLEEPVATTCIILLTRRPDALLSTIRSRCQVFRFAPVAVEQIEKHLIGSGAFSEADARLSARLSRGSLGQAIAIDVERVRERRASLIQMLDDVFGRADMVSALRVSEALTEAKNKESFEDDLELLMSLIRDIWAISLGERGGSLVHSDEFDELAKIAKTSDPQHFSAAMNEIELMQQRFAVNINRRIAADAVLAAMAGGKN